VPSKPSIAAGVAVVAALAAGLWLMAAREEAPAAASAAPVRTAGTRIFGEVGARPGVPAPSEKAGRLRQLAEQFKHADHTYCSYLESTRYPAASRPISEHPDQVYPNQPVTEMHAMRSEGGRSDARVQIQTSQSRVFMVAGEAVAFSVRAVDAEGKTLPLVITRALAQGMTFAGSRPSAQVALAFADDGKGADPVPGDGAFAGVLSPAQTGLATFNGTIRTEVRYSVNGSNGFVLFDVVYSPDVPATWTGQVREVVDNGSLAYLLKADVRQAGRYIVTGRVDDANGKPFALATFNDVLGTGPNEIKLTVFGKLLHDQQPPMPLTLRDVDGYLLKENTDPDRALMPRLEGKVLAGKPQPLKNFSDAEWQGEERTRYLTEFAKDVALARNALADFDPSAPAPASACAN
jgi:hypothetical protein